MSFDSLIDDFPKKVLVVLQILNNFERTILHIDDHLIEVSFRKELLEVGVFDTEKLLEGHGLLGIHFIAMKFTV